MTETYSEGSAGRQPVAPGAEGGGGTVNEENKSSKPRAMGKTP